MNGPNGAMYVTQGVALWLFSNLGIILLLFLVGLESRVDRLLEVGLARCWSRPWAWPRRSRVGLCRAGAFTPARSALSLPRSGVARPQPREP
jgi:hypothetical protein